MTASPVYLKIQDDVMIARKERNAVKLKTLLPLLGDIQKIGKDKRRNITDDDCYAVLKSTMKSVAIIIGTSGVTPIRMGIAREEMALLKSYLPDQPDQADIDAAIVELKSQGLNKGLIIKGLKEKFGSTFDVGAIAKTL